MMLWKISGFILLVILYQCYQLVNTQSAPSIFGVIEYGTWTAVMLPSAEIINVWMH